MLPCSVTVTSVVTGFTFIKPFSTVKVTTSKLGFVFVKRPATRFMFVVPASVRVAVLSAMAPSKWT